MQFIMRQQNFQESKTGPRDNGSSGLLAPLIAVLNGICNSISFSEKSRITVYIDLFDFVLFSAQKSKLALKGRLL